MPRDEEAEYLDLGSGRTSNGPLPPVAAGSRPGRRGRRSLAAPMSLAAVLGLLVLFQSCNPSSPLPPRAANPSRTYPSLPSPGNAHDSGSPAPASPSSSPPAGPPVVTEGEPLLPGVPGEVFALTNKSLLRIELATGRRTTTPLPAMTGPLDATTLLVGRSAALIQRQSVNDGVQVLMVADGRAAESLAEAGNNALPWLPGPDGDHLWRSSSTGGWTLVTFHADPTTAVIPMPDQPPPLAVTGDGSGHVAIQTLYGSYEWSPQRSWHRISPGRLLAAGPTRYLVSECDDTLRCSIVAITRPDGDRLPVPGAETLAGGRLLDGIDPAFGSVSPDGRYGLLAGPFGGRLIELSTGRAREVVIDVRESGIGEWAVWAPDSSRLLIVDGVTLKSLDPQTGAMATLLANLPGVPVLAMRS